jgi:hypothetical protein
MKAMKARTEICKKFSIPNSTLFMIIKNRDKNCKKIMKLASLNQIENICGREHLRGCTSCMFQTSELPECSCLQSTSDGGG